MRIHSIRSIKRTLVLVFGLSLIFSTQAFSQIIGSLTPTSIYDGKWGTDVKEALDAMKLKGSVEDGRLIYHGMCQICHQPGANGDTVGNFPQLAGQHSTVLIKQIVDIRAGNRDNPTMYPFTNVQALKLLTQDIFGEARTGPQTLADVAAYIQTLPMGNTVKGSGDDLEHGRKVYEKNCIRCHGDHGQGNLEYFYPVIAGQNYNYLLRQFRWIKKGKRRNANPEMVEQIRNFSERDILAVMDWVSRQTMSPGDWK